MARHKIVVAEPYAADAMEKLRRAADVVELDCCDEQSLTRAVDACDALLVRTSALVTRRVIESASRLKVIGRGGVGLDNIDLNAARERGIRVVYTPQAATEAVADLTFALILGLIWNTRGNDRAIREGRFREARELATPTELCGLTLGVIGMGRIGRAVARRAVNGFLMEVHYNDIMKPDPPLDFAARTMTKDELYRTADIVTLHVPLTAQTKGMVDARAISVFKKGAMLINTSRGAVVNLDHVQAALRSGQLGAVGLDVFYPEPITPAHPILEAPNALLTPHIGARTQRAQRAMNGVVDDVIRVLEGKEPHYEAVSD